MTQHHEPGNVDDVIARRVMYEMGRRNWSYGNLAALMARQGCPISKAALHRVVNGNPSGNTRRTLSAREAVAFAAVLGVDVSSLLAPPSETHRHPPRPKSRRQLCTCHGSEQR